MEAHTDPVQTRGVLRVSTMRSARYCPDLPSVLVRSRTASALLVIIVSWVGKMTGR